MWTDGAIHTVIHNPTLAHGRSLTVLDDYSQVITTKRSYNLTN